MAGLIVENHIARFGLARKFIELCPYGTLCGRVIKKRHCIASIAETTSSVGVQHVHNIAITAEKRTYAI